MKEKILLYGAGKIGREAALLLKNNGMNLQCFIDNNPTKHSQMICGLNVVYINEIELLDNCVVYITTVKNIMSIINELMALGMKRQNIIIYELYRLQYIAKQYKKAYIRLNKNNLAFDCYNGLGLGGVEEWTKHITKQLLLKGYEAKIIYSGEKCSPDKNLIYINKEETDIDLIESVNNVKNYIEGNKCGVIITSTPGDVLRAGCVIKLKHENVKIICVIHNGIELNYERYPLYNDYVDAYIGVSEDICEELARRGINKNKIYHMTCPVKIMDKSIKRTYALDRKEPIRIGYAGRMEIEQKRMDLLMKLIFELEENNVNYSFNIAGDGTYKEHMISVINEKGFNSRVNFWGKIDRDEIPEFWQNNDICVNVSDYEGRSISIMEAMVNGAVPVVTKTSGVKEDIHNNIDGYYVDIEDYKGIEKNIAYLEKNRNELGRLGFNAKKEMEEKCNINSHVDFWCDLLERI